MDTSYVPCILTELRFVISQMRILGTNRTYTNIPKEDVTTFLSRAIALIECLDGALKDCEEAAEEDEETISYWKESYMEAKDELVTLHEKFNKLKFDEELAKKIINQIMRERDIWREKALVNALERDRNSDLAIYWKCICHKLEKVINDREMRNLIREKSDQEVCKACDREDCSNCTLCPF